jgi:uncharacterized membrane protein YeaQ/YmgE (transglycosylase-associated protein family)
MELRIDVLLLWVALAFIATWSAGRLVNPHTRCAASDLMVGLTGTLIGGYVAGGLGLTSSELSTSVAVLNSILAAFAGGLAFASAGRMLNVRRQAR